MKLHLDDRTINSKEEKPPVRHECMTILQPLPEESFLSAGFCYASGWAFARHLKNSFWLWNCAIIR
jgi:hypothetical protein